MGPVSRPMTNTLVSESPPKNDSVSFPPNNLLQTCKEVKIRKKMGRNKQRVWLGGEEVRLKTNKFMVTNQSIIVHANLLSSLRLIIFCSNNSRLTFFFPFLFSIRLLL